MKKADSLVLLRREFITSASLLLLGGRLWGISPFLPQSAQADRKLKEELTQEEVKWVEKSSIAKEIKGYFGKNYSCAESLLMVSLKYLGKPEEFVWIASGFGGGLYHKDLCGFLTAGIMAIGLRASTLKKERKDAKDYCKNLVKEYWKWWTSSAPLHCSEIRKERTSNKVCRRLGQLASAKIEELITPERTSL